MKLCEKFSVGQFNEIVSENFDNVSTIEDFDDTSELQNILEKFKINIFDNNHNMFLSKYVDIIKIHDDDNKYLTLQWNNIHQKDFSNLVSVIFLLICGKTISDNIYENFVLAEFKKTGPTKRPIFVIKLWLKNLIFENILNEICDVVLKYKLFVPECYDALDDYITNLNIINKYVEHVIPHDKYVYCISHRKFNTLKKYVNDPLIISKIENIIEIIKDNKFMIISK